MDGCIFIFKQQEYDTEAAKLAQLSYYQADHRALVRHFASHASVQTPDSLGRLTLPADLRQLAGITKSIVIVGALTRLEVWDQDRYHQFFDNLAQTIDTQVEQIAV